MFGLFKPRTFNFDYTFKCRMSSALEAFLIQVGSNWDNPEEDIKKYRCIVHPQGNINFAQDSHAFQKGTYNVYLEEIAELEGITHSKIKTIKQFASGPLICPSVETASNQIVEKLQAIHSRQQSCSR